MIDDKIKGEILKNIILSGSADMNIANSKPVIADNKNLHAILDLSSGKPRIHPHRIKQFSLILSQPQALSILNPFEIRCALCKRVISYPTWYYEVKYAINHIHYFVCFDKSNPSKPIARCYRRGL